MITSSGYCRLRKRVGNKWQKKEAKGGGERGGKRGEVVIKLDFDCLCIRRKRIKWNVRNCDIFAC